ncbi:hypothetical protein [Bacillus bingmayongensis]|nr:hypothetical protein [Bacillus bingmayongensis]MBY0599375.1 hypothetical protein [Bacillus bingmayongensis]
MDQENKGFSRRKFLGNVCKIGGATAVLGVTDAMGLFVPENVSADEKEKKDDHNIKKTE